MRLLDNRGFVEDLHRALRTGAERIANGERRAAAVEAAMAGVLAAEPLLGAVDYATVVAADTLQPLDPLAGELRLLVAAHLGAARLIDNIGTTVPPP